MQNGYIERFNRVNGEAKLDAYLFFDLYQVKQLTEEWMEEYNQLRTHEDLNTLSPEKWTKIVSTPLLGQLLVGNFFIQNRVTPFYRA